MATKTEGQHTGEFVVAESPGKISRDQVTVTVPASRTLKAGAVLGKLSNGKYAPYDDANTDGSETAAGVLYDEIVNDALTAADKAGVIINWSAEVRSADLQWETGVDETGGLADLAALGVKAR